MRGAFSDLAFVCCSFPCRPLYQSTDKILAGRTPHISTRVFTLDATTPPPTVPRGTLHRVTPPSHLNAIETQSQLHYPSLTSTGRQLRNHSSCLSRCLEPIPRFPWPPTRPRAAPVASLSLTRVKPRCRHLGSDVTFGLAASLEVCDFGREVSLRFTKHRSTEPEVPTAATKGGGGITLEQRGRLLGFNTGVILKNPKRHRGYFKKSQVAFLKIRGKVGDPFGVSCACPFAPSKRGAHYGWGEGG